MLTAAWPSTAGSIGRYRTRSPMRSSATSVLAGASVPDIVIDALLACAIALPPAAGGPSSGDHRRPGGSAGRAVGTGLDRPHGVRWGRAPQGTFLPAVRDVTRGVRSGWVRSMGRPPSLGTPAVPIVRTHRLLPHTADAGVEA